MGSSALPPEDAATIQREWLRRVEAEYRSSGITHHLTLWLLQLTAPLELVRMGLGIVEDELVHSELSYRVHAAAGGTTTLELAPHTIGLVHPPPERLLDAVTCVTVETFCLGETVAVRLFSRLRAPATQPEARTAFDRILKDEVRHKEFGWTLLEWLFSTPRADEARAIARRHLPAAFTRLRQNYAHSALGQEAPHSPLLAAWGLMPPPDYAATLEETLRKDYVPLFAELGVDAKQAWSAQP